MALNVHVARVGVLNVDMSGNVVKKDDPSVSLKQQLQTQMDHRVLEDSAIANSAGNPSVKAYIEAEAGDDYAVHYMDQTTIITYLRTTAGGFG
jgi:hypothetical protein